MYTYREPYVQDVKEWVAHYSQGIRTSGSQKKRETDAENVAPPNAGSLSETGTMSVTRVEPKGRLPQVPNVSAPVPIACLSESQTSVQQATLDALRMQISRRANKTHGATKKSKRSTSTTTKGGNGTTKGKRKGAQTNAKKSRQSKKTAE